MIVVVVVVYVGLARTRTRPTLVAPPSSSSSRELSLTDGRTDRPQTGKEGRKEGKKEGSSLLFARQSTHLNGRRDVAVVRHSSSLSSVETEVAVVKQ